MDAHTSTSQQVDYAMDDWSLISCRLETRLAPCFWRTTDQTSSSLAMYSVCTAGESLNTSYLTPYLEPLGPDFRNGVNFAFSGAATQPRYKPFSLDVQILQFLRFRARSPELFSKGYKDFVDEDAFKDAIHIIDIGQNDLAGSFEYLSYEQVIKNISSFIKEINYAMQNIYQHGGRNFWIHNTGPLGCLPQKLATFDKKSSDFDQYGCLKTLNDAAKQFNDQLRVLCEELRSELKNSTIVYVDMYSIKYDLIANATTYGMVSFPNCKKFIEQI
ncbi:GDSL esterase/lipase [Populus alba x Populus x berolinensis]|nr:GDSL esterase/lipase [Populus alba x Populus x berolinensis]